MAQCSLLRIVEGTEFRAVSVFANGKEIHQSSSPEVEDVLDEKEPLVIGKMKPNETVCMYIQYTARWLTTSQL